MRITELFHFCTAKLNNYLNYSITDLPNQVIQVPKFMEISDSSPENHRNWSEIPCDVILMILMKLGTVEILESVQFVCKMWYNLCKEPSIWHTIHINGLDEPIPELKLEKMLVNAVDRSAGGLIDLNIEGFGSDELCSYFASRSTQLKRLRLVCCDYISDKVIIGALESLTSLEELELTLCDFQDEAAIPIINSCPSLTTFKFNPHGSKFHYNACDNEALAIAGNMPELRHLQLFRNGLTNDGLRAILDGCPHLQSLDLRACFHIELVGNLEKRLLEQIKDFRRPYDSTDDCNYITIYDSITDTDDYEVYDHPLGSD
ncbi:putative F-box/LRR-repeat protein 9 [Silene latifolia]|uniref:putative F-box/LRR-repeat protein 9 n=1 Tax=Silene latifolia TaxID=37657 RepID=UPI003D77C8AB